MVSATVLKAKARVRSPLDMRRSVHRFPFWEQSDDNYFINWPAGIYHIQSHHEKSPLNNF